MRFTVSNEAIERLGLPTDLKERVFTGPEIRRGLLAGFTAAERRYACQKLLRVDNIQAADVTDVGPTYYFLSVRREDARAIPEAKFPDLAELDFTIEPHAHVGDMRTCKECGGPLEDDVHDVPDQL